MDHLGRTLLHKSRRTNVLRWSQGIVAIAIRRFVASHVDAEIRVVLPRRKAQSGSADCGEDGKSDDHDPGKCKHFVAGAPRDLSDRRWWERR